MIITYISHACLYVETSDTTLVFDPWIDGPAYMAQWNVFPAPTERALARQAAVVVISHGHEDHLHPRTLANFRKNKTLLYPYYWYGDTIRYLRQFQFSKTIEAIPGRRYSLGTRTFITAIVNGQDSILVLEADGQVIVNVNDALHSCDARLIELYTTILKKRWPKIDVVFCGFAGASYFPNVFHCPGKDDAEVARLREELYVYNFCRVVDRLSPDIAVPFAADFVLLDPRQRWINATRFPREQIARYYSREFLGSARSEIVVMYPGDRLVDKQLHASALYRTKGTGETRDGLVRAQYPDACSVFTQPPKTEVPQHTIAAMLQEHIDREARHYRSRAIDQLHFALHLRDLEGQRWFNVRLDGRKATVTASAEPDEEAAIRVETVTGVVLNSMTSDWGGDALIIGYGCEVEIMDPGQATRARTCVELLTRYPRPRTYAPRHPWRAFRYALGSLPAIGHRIAFRLQHVAGRDAVASKSAMGGHLWLTGDLERIRRTNGLQTQYSSS